MESLCQQLKKIYTAVGHAQKICISLLVLKSQFGLAAIFLAFVECIN